jgi:electron transport complex protein RnfG
LRKIIQKNGLILGGFALVTTSVIALTFSFTHERIEQAKERQLLSTLNQVIDKSMHDNQLHLDCIIVAPNELLGSKPQRVFRARLNGNNTALIIEATAPDGYSGAINLVVALDTNQTVLGARVVEHKETPGLGDKVELRISDWILDFDNVKYNEETMQRWQVKKDGGQFDQFTGATITPRSVVKAIKNAAIYGQANMQQLFSTKSNCKQASPTQGNLLKPSSVEETSSE